MMTDGEVKKIDQSAGKITIKHGPLANLDIPSMTMVFRVKDPAWLSQVKVGDKIGFVAEKVNGAMTVTKLEPRNLTPWIEGLPLQWSHKKCVHGEH